MFRIRASILAGGFIRGRIPYARLVLAALIVTVTFQLSLQPARSQTDQSATQESGLFENILSLGESLGSDVGRVLSEARRAAGLAPLNAVATFESIGLYWFPPDNPDKRDCEVRYRDSDGGSWLPGHPLWFDERNGECRGSLVHLKPGHEYDVRVSLPGSFWTVTTSVSTWSEDFPISRRVELPAFSDEPLVITESGTPEGYVLYTAAPGREAVIDVGGLRNNNVVIDASHVILRGLTLKNAGEHAVFLGQGAHDLVIEENDISGWGEVAESGWGADLDSAIYSKKKTLARLVVQRNRLHHPRSDSNAWDEYREKYDSYHPGGPQAITLWNSEGNHVIRYNEIYSDDDHRFNDCIGGGSNYSFRGSPHRDSDIYGNSISHCWDDAIEVEGANINVRVWGNYIDQSFVMIAAAPTTVGPLYVWRNLADRSRLSATKTMQKSKRGPFFKTQSKTFSREDDEGKKTEIFYGGGRIYLYHNTLFQRPGENQGVYVGPADLGGLMRNVVTRNNIFHVISDSRYVILDKHRSLDNDFDYDLYNGRLSTGDWQEPNGIIGKPRYRDFEPGAFPELLPESPGVDAALPLNNFNDDYSGLAPDMGASELDRRRLQAGTAAYRH